MLNHALADVASGGCECVLVVGGEDRAWARSGRSGCGTGAGAAADAGVGAVPRDGAARDQGVARAMVAAARGPAPGSPDEIVTRPPEFIAPIEIAAGIVLPPVQQYALIENALGAAEGLQSGVARGRDRRPVGPFQRGGTAQSRRRLRPGAHVGRAGAPRAAEPPARASLTTDGTPASGRSTRPRPSSSAPSAGPAAPASRRTAGFSRCRAALVGRGDPDRRADGSRRGPPWPCWAGRPRPGSAGPCATSTGRGLLLLPGRRARPAARARARSLGYADCDRRHGLRRRSVQPLRAALDRGRRPTAPGATRRAGTGHDGVGHALQAGAGRVERHSAARSTPGDLVADLAVEAAAATEVVPVADPAPQDSDATVVSFTVTPVLGHTGLGPTGSRRTPGSDDRVECFEPPWWPICLMGSGPRPPAKMRTSPGSPSPRVSSGGPST